MLELDVKLKHKDLKESKNINDLLDEDTSTAIGGFVFDGYDQDEKSRSGWVDRNKEAMKLALQVVEPKTYPWPKASNIKFPLLTVGAMQFQARSYPALVKGPEIAKFRKVGGDTSGARSARASRVQQYINYQLMEQDEGWEEGFDKLLMVLPILGSCYRKKFWSETDEEIKTCTVLPNNLVVDYYTQSIDSAERVTELYPLYDRQIRERVLRGVFSEVDLGDAPIVEKPDSNDQTSPPTSAQGVPRVLLEQCSYLDLDGDGYPEPYIVTIDKHTKKVLRIVNRYREVISEQSLAIDELNDQLKVLGKQARDLSTQALEFAKKGLAVQNQQQGGQQDPRMKEEAEQKAKQIQQQLEALANRRDMVQEEIESLKKEKPKILRIEPIQTYTKYGFIPCPDGSFYDLGLGVLLGPLNRSVNTLINQLNDAGTMSNLGGGWMGKGARVKGGSIRFRPGEWKRVNTAGQTLKDSIVPMPINAPSPVLFNLLSLLIDFSQQISSVTDAMTGQNPGQNTPAYNMQQMLQQGMQIFNGIFKRIHRSLRQELREQYRLNGIYLNEQEYFATMGGEEKVLRSDFSGDGKEIYPAADPNAFANQENMTKAQILAQRSMESPGYDKVAVEKRLLESMDIPNINEVYPTDAEGKLVNPPGPDPELELKKAEEQRRTTESKERGQVNAMKAEADVLLKQVQAMKLTKEAEVLGDKVLIEQFNAVTKRMAQHSETLKNIIEGGNAERERTERVKEPSKPE